MKQTAETYILSKLEELKHAIPTLKILYKKDSFTREYLVKVIPSKEVETSALYQEFESEVILNFVTKYPFDSVVFMTENEWIDVRDPEKVFIGDAFEEEAMPTFAANDYFIFEQEDEDFFNISGMLYDFSSELQKHISRMTSYSSISPPFDDWLKLSLFPDCSEPGGIYGFIGNHIVVDDQSMEEDDSNCENYALAA